MIQHKTPTPPRAPYPITPTLVVTCRALAWIFLHFLIAAPAYANVNVKGTATISPDGKYVSWEFSNWVFDWSSPYTCWPGCGSSTIGWAVDDGSQRLDALPVAAYGVCWDGDSNQVSAAQDLVRSIPTTGRRVPSGHAPEASLSGTLISCDKRTYVYLKNSNRAPPVFPLSCTLTGPNSLSYEIENGTETKNAGMVVTCTGAGRASATVSVEGASSVKPVTGLTVSTKVVSKKIDVEAGYSSPIDITVTVKALNPEPGIYQSTFVYVLDII